MAHPRETRSLSRWDPFRDLDLFTPFDRLLGESRPAVRANTMPVDVTETDTHYVVSAELPGVKKDDIGVELHEGVLTITAEKKSEREETSDRGRWLERSFGSFSRAFTLPPDANHDAVDASYADGVLEVRVAKVPEAKPQTISVS